MNIFIAKLSPSTTGTDLEGLFEDYGQVNSAKVIMDKFTGNSKRFGFVEMEDEEDGQKAIADLNDSQFDNSNIVVKKANPPKENSGNFGGNRYGNSNGNRY